MSSHENKPGLSLADIGVPRENVALGKENVLIRGLSAEDLFYLFDRFPEIQTWVSGAPINPMKTPQALAALIAVAGGFSAGDEKGEQLARNLPVESQLDILEAVGRLTFKSGFGPFAERLTALLNGVAVALPSLRSGKAQVTNSRPVSKPSSPPDLDMEPSGS